jgi:hypothetical protein
MLEEQAEVRSEEQCGMRRNHQNSYFSRGYMTEDPKMESGWRAVIGEERGAVWDEEK